MTPLSSFMTHFCVVDETAPPVGEDVGVAAEVGVGVTVDVGVGVSVVVGPGVGVPPMPN